MIGGYLAEPYGRVPILSDKVFFQKYPYTAPGLLLCSTTILASMAVLVLVKEVRHNSD